MSNILAFETSSPILSVALQAGSSPAQEIRLDGFLSHAENLLPCVDKLLKKTKLSINEIDTLLIGQGPGSFTGLRIGFASLKGFLAVQKRKCYGALSMDLIAEGIKGREGDHLAVCLDARRGKLFIKHYLKNKNEWIAQSKVLIQGIEEIIAGLPQRVILVGDALQKYGHALTEATGDKEFTLLNEKVWYPKASNLIKLHERRLKNKASSPLVELKTQKDFLPLYFRLSEPEEKKKDHANAR